MFDFNHYSNICAATAASEDLFDNFRRETTFVDMYEHVTYDQGLVYLDEIRKVPAIFNNIDMFLYDDKVGNPVKHHYEALGMVAPTTLRYIKVLADLYRLFGGLDKMNIIEIGGGYGGQYKVINDMFSPASYTVIDLPYVVELAKKYLKKYGFNFNVSTGPYDLFISNYAFTEINRGYQDIYYENFIKKASKGYITCNFYEWSETENMMTFNELIRMVPGSKVYEEIPLTAKDNFILTWGSNASL